MEMNTDPPASSPLREIGEQIVALMRFLFLNGIGRFVVLILLGLHVRHRERLPARGPAILAANHNSHLDTLVLMSLFPVGYPGRLRPVAAADYFLRTGAMSWFSRQIIGIIPIKRQRSHPDEDVLAPCYPAIEANQILILFPEGSRGEPEVMSRFKSGIARLAERYPTLPVHPIYLHGLGKALPRGEALLVPFFCDVFVGEPLFWRGDTARFMGDLAQAMERLGQEGHFPEWT